MQNRNLNAIVAFFEAIRTGKINSIKPMLNKGMDINIASPLNGNDTPLHYAARHGQPKIAQLLLERGANEKLLNDNKQTAIEVACLNKNFDALKSIVDYLRNNEKAPTPDELTASITQAASNGEVETVKYLLDSGASPDACPVNGSPALHLAAQNGHEKIVTILLDAGADIELLSNITNDTALSCAVKKNQYGMTKLLLERGADPDVQRNSKKSPTPMALAINQDLTDIFELLLDHGANHDMAFSSELPIAIQVAQNNRPAMLKALIKRNIPVTNTDASGKTALHYAAIHDYEEIATILCEAGIDIHVRDKHGRSALADAVSNNKSHHVAAILFENGANANDVVDGNPLITLAIKARSKKSVTLLIKNGADVNAKNHRLETPLFRAVMKRSTDIIKILLNANADPTAVNKAENMTALELAVIDSNKAIVELLIKHNAEVTEQILINSALHSTFAMFSFLYGLRNLNASHFECVCAYIRNLLRLRTPVDLILRVLPLFQNDKRINSLDLAIAFADENKIFSQTVLAEFNKSQTKKRSKKQRSMQELLNRLLIKAIKNQDNEKVQILINHGADVKHVHDQSNYTYYTPLHLAASMGNCSIASLLIAHGADIHALNDVEGTPLQEAAINNHTSMVKLLVEAGAHLDSMNCFEETTIYLAAMHGHHETVKMLISFGADTELTSRVTRYHLNDYIKRFGGSVADKINELLTDKKKKYFHFNAAKIAELMGHQSIAHIINVMKQPSAVALKKPDTCLKHSTLFAYYPQEELDLPEFISIAAEDENEGSNCNIPEGRNNTNQLLRNT